MKKRELLDLIIIVVGILTVVKAFVVLIEELIEKTFNYNYIKDSFWPFTFTFVLMFLGFFLMLKPHIISKFIIKSGDNDKIELSLKRNDIIHVTIIVLCLYFSVSLLPDLLSQLNLIFFEIFDNKPIDFTFLPREIGLLILYFSIIFILIYSRKFSLWLEKKKFN